jgi:hypothetical protein
VFGRHPLRAGFLNLSIVYECVTSAGSESLWLLNSRFLQIGNISLPISRFWTFCISGISEASCIDTESTTVKSLLFSVPSSGSYSIRALNDDLMGFFQTSSGLRSFDVSSNFSFIPEVHFVSQSSPTPAASQARPGTFTVSLSVDSHSRTSEVVPSTSKVVSPTSKVVPPTSKVVPPTSEGLTGGAIACIVVSCVVVVGVVVVVICLIKKRHYHEKIQKSVEPDDSFFSSQNSWSKTNFSLWQDG